MFSGEIVWLTTWLMILGGTENLNWVLLSCKSCGGVFLTDFEAAPKTLDFLLRNDLFKEKLSYQLHFRLWIKLATPPTEFLLILDVRHHMSCKRQIIFIPLKIISFFKHFKISFSENKSTISRKFMFFSSFLFMFHSIEICVKKWFF